LGPARRPGPPKGRGGRKKGSTSQDRFAAYQAFTMRERGYTLSEIQKQLSVYLQAKAYLQENGQREDDGPRSHEEILKALSARPEGLNYRGSQDKPYARSGKRYVDAGRVIFAKLPRDVRVEAQGLNAWWRSSLDRHRDQREGRRPPPR
jgi:hypothetical protein